MKYLKNTEIGQLDAKLIKKEETFLFECHPDLTCFNICCRNLKLFLYPYDIIKLKQALNISSDEFIDKHTDIIIRPETCFPEVLLKMAENRQKTCPFLQNNGCSVYNARPYACRTFPMEQGLIYNEDKKTAAPVYFFKPPEFCMGKNQKKEWTPETWIKDQDAVLYNNKTILWSKIKSLFYQYPPWTPDNTDNPKLKASFMALYNIDKFREFVFSSTFLKRYKIKPDLKRRIKKDDEALLKLAFAFVKLYLWNVGSKIIK
ncbi:MAG: YkgJ family cysteine cluster protein [Deltaproteobacteria bacterium]|nr:YkgJ family cysteine cluster protein [Deltaproteobacteria bacterium]